MIASPTGNGRRPSVKKAPSLAAPNVIRALADNHWLSDQGVTILQQGSYHNNTNVRAEADIDLRAAHPSIKVEYGPNVHVETAASVLDDDFGMTLPQIFGTLRAELAADLSSKFGSANVDASGKKAIRIRGITRELCRGRRRPNR